MAKVQIKSEKITLFGGIFHVREQLYRNVGPIIDKVLGLSAHAPIATVSNTSNESNFRLIIIFCFYCYCVRIHAVTDCPMRCLKARLKVL